MPDHLDLHAQAAYIQSLPANSAVRDERTSAVFVRGTDGRWYGQGAPKGGWNGPDFCQRLTVVYRPDDNSPALSLTTEQAKAASAAATGGWSGDWHWFISALGHLGVTVNDYELPAGLAPKESRG